METYYHMPPSSMPTKLSNSEKSNKNDGGECSAGVSNEKNSIEVSSLYTSGAKSKVKMTDLMSSGFSSCKDLSPKHSIGKQDINLHSPQSGRKEACEIFNKNTSLVNSNFSPAYSFESETLVSKPTNPSSINSSKQSFPNKLVEADQSDSLPTTTESNNAAMSFSIPQLSFPSYFSKNNVSSFLFNNTSQTKLTPRTTEENKLKKDNKLSNSSSSPYTFFQMESDDDFDFDVVDDINNHRQDQDLETGGCGVGFNDTDDDELEDLGASHSRWYNLTTNGSNNDDRLIAGSFVSGEKQACLSQSSSIISMPVCRICQLPGMEPANHLISPCRCLGSIRYVHNNCLLVSLLPCFHRYAKYIIKDMTYLCWD